jgi:hypothetical protein
MMVSCPKLMHYGQLAKGGMMMSCPALMHEGQQTELIYDGELPCSDAVMHGNQIIMISCPEFIHNGQLHR